MKTKILLLGNFGYRTNKLDGQTIKTRSVYNLLSQNSSDKVLFYDTSYLSISVFEYVKLLYMILCACKIIIMPARKAFGTLFPIVYVISKLFNKKIVYIAIGGWQMEYIEGTRELSPHPRILKMLKNVSACLLETKYTYRILKNKYCLDNVDILPNFRRIDYKPSISRNTGSLRMVFMARINRCKGYDVIFDFDSINYNLDYNIDFYGPINDDDKDDFLLKIARSHKICYKGVLEPNLIYNILPNYDLMLFPTQYYTEGFPGTILDSYICGLPVIATAWKHAFEFIKDGITGFVIPFENPQSKFNQIIIRLMNDRELLRTMKDNAYREADNYTEANAWSVLKKYV